MLCIDNNIERSAENATGALAGRNSSGSHAHLASPGAVFNLGLAMQQHAIPPGVKGWSWGAFLLSWIWAIRHNTWLGLLALVPSINLPVMIWLGCKGREMAWCNCEWQSVAHFNRVQRRWSQWGISLVVVATILMVALLLLAPNIATSTTPDVDSDVVQVQDSNTPDAACS